MYRIASAQSSWTQPLQPLDAEDIKRLISLPQREPLLTIFKHLRFLSLSSPMILPELEKRLLSAENAKKFSKVIIGRHCSM
jgi:hypothetical protein